MRSSRNRMASVALCALVVSLFVIRVVAAPAEGAFTGLVKNASNVAGSGVLSFTHTYTSTTCSLASTQASSINCVAAINSTAATPATGDVSGTDVVTNEGNIPASSLVQQVEMSSCGPVQLANVADGSNPMLPRYDTSFNTSGGPMGGAGYVTFDGATAYASDVVSQSQPAPELNLNETYGLGIWFNTTSTAGGPLFGFGSNPTDVAGTNDRILYMNKSGQLGFVLNTTPVETGLSTASFNNGQWHFAYVTLSQISALGLGVESTVTLYVDGTQEATGGGLGEGLSSYAGYWHAGWSPISAQTYGSGLSNFFSGSLSNFVVLNNEPAPSGTTLGEPATQSAFNSAISSSVTEHWIFNDTGTTTFAGPYPVIGATSPCSMIDMEWGFATPTSCAAAPTSNSAACTSFASLSSFSSDGWVTIAAPGPGQTQTSTFATTRDPTYNSYVSGLRLYAPVSERDETLPNDGWSVTFVWPSAAGSFIA
ncbi:MAG TPA: hypothetical protein VK704_05630 [Acidimicrobiales bacterium]|nr:hypothetical protein [Acidimicrobiales bacterium]